MGKIFTKETTIAILIVTTSSSKNNIQEQEKIYLFSEKSNLSTRLADRRKNSKNNMDLKWMYARTLFFVMLSQSLYT